MIREKDHGRERPPAAPRDDARRPAADGPAAGEDLDAWPKETFPTSDPLPLSPSRLGAPH